MINKRQILLVILIFSALVTSAQFSIDVYSGYNHSNNEYVLPIRFNYACYKTYYSDVPYDTIYSHTNPDSIIGIRYEVRYFYEDTGESKHNFASNYVYGINMFYQYASFFRTGLLIEKHGFEQQASSFSITNTEQRFDKYDQLFYSDGVVYDFIYNVLSTSLIQSFCYTRNRFVFNVDIGLNTYYSIMEYDGLYQYKSVYNEWYMYSDYDYSYDVKRRYQGWSFGFRTSIGASFRIYDNIAFFGSIGYTWANLEFQNGVTLVDDFLQVDLSDIYDDYEIPELPQEIAPENIPFGKINYNSLNLRIGLRYTFGEKEKE